MLYLLLRRISSVVRIYLFIYKYFTSIGVTKMYQDSHRNMEETETGINYNLP